MYLNFVFSNNMMSSIANLYLIFEKKIFVVFNFFLLYLLLFCFFFSLNRFEELVKKFKVEYHAGGSTQNSVKVAQVCSYLKNYR